MRKCLPLFLLAFLALGSTCFAEDMKVGFVYVSPVGDAGYSYAHDQGRLAVEAMDGVTTSFVESVAEGQDSERVIMNMARKGYDVIFATSYGYMDPMLKVSKDFPKVKFLHCSGYKNAENMANYFGRIYQARYLTGMVAGAMTKSNVLGYVAAFPIPEVIRGINAFTLGAQAVNPDVQVRVVWTKTWYDPATEKEAGKSLLDVGCDVIAQHQDSPGPQEAAQERGVYSVGYNTDMSSFCAQVAPDRSHLELGPVLYGNGPADQRRHLEERLLLAWTGQGHRRYRALRRNGSGRCAETVLDKKAEIAAGTYQVFTGPIKDQSGAEKVAAGTVMADADLLGFNWFVQGVVGTLE